MNPEMNAKVVELIDLLRELKPNLPAQKPQLSKDEGQLQKKGSIRQDAPEVYCEVFNERRTIEFVVCHKDQVYDGTALCDVRLVIDKLAWEKNVPPDEIMDEIKEVITRTPAAYEQTFWSSSPNEIYDVIRE